MPRHNNRKRIRHEGELGFDPMKYIGSRAPRKGHPYRYPMRMERKADTNRFDRHKAHAPTMKQHRAMAEIKRLHKQAELAWYEPAISTAPATTTAPAITTTPTTTTTIPTPAINE